MNLFGLFGKHRSEEEIKKDLQALMDEITVILNGLPDGGSGPLMFYAILKARPDLDKRWKKLNKEAAALEKSKKV